MQAVPWVRTVSLVSSHPLGTRELLETNSNPVICDLLRFYFEGMLRYLLMLNRGGSLHMGGCAGCHRAADIAENFFEGKKKKSVCMCVCGSCCCRKLGRIPTGLIGSSIRPSVVIFTCPCSHSALPPRTKGRSSLLASTRCPWCAAKKIN